MKEDNLVSTNSLKDISNEKLINIVYYLALVWVLSPLLIMLLNLCGVYALYVNNTWIEIVYLIGFVGIAVGIIYLYKIVSKNSSQTRKQFVLDLLPLEILFFFLVWTFICCILSENKKIAFMGNDYLHEGYFTYIAYMGFFLIGLILIGDKTKLKKIANLFLIVASIMSVLSLIDNSLSEAVFFNQFLTTTTSYQGVFYNTNHFGYYLLIAILTDYFLLESSDTPIKTGVYIIVYTLLVNMLIFNDTLGDYLAVNITLLFIIIWKFINKEKGKIKAISLWILLLVISLLSLIYTKNLYIDFVSLLGDFELLNRFFGGIIPEEDISSIGSARGVRWAATIRFIKQSPIVGYGLENAKILFDSIDVYENRPHNIFLQMALFTGIPGMIIYFSAYLVSATRLFKEKKGISFINEACGFIVVGYLISEFFGLSAFYTSPYFLIILGMCCSGCLNNLNKGMVENNEKM